MRAKIILSDEAGNVFEGEVFLQPTTVGSNNLSPVFATTEATTEATVPNFDLPERAFVKTYGSRLGGAQKFALILAYLAKGKVGVAISVKDVVKHWNQMKSLLGGEFNAAYSVRAKERGLVDSPSKGQYVLCSGWAQCNQ